VRPTLAGLVTVGLAAAALTGCSSRTAGPTAAPPPTATTTAPPTTTTPDPVPAELAKMTLPQKVGQMFVSIVYGGNATSPTPADSAANQKDWGPDVATGAAAVARYHLGGVIYFSWTHNLDAPGQIAGLSSGLQQAAVGDTGIPLQISVDQEGGSVNRINGPLAVSPGNMAIGATGDPHNAYRAAFTTGVQLRAMGINMDDAPVVDVNTNPRNTADGTRSFGDQTAAVSAFGAAAIAGFQAAGVAAQAKHFPGLGASAVNTDNAPAVTNETRAQLLSVDLPAFQAAIKAGVSSVMSAHITAPALDPSGRPASLSQPIVTGLLRDTLHYNGVVATDSLRAGALAAIPGDQVVLDAINAGEDELLMPASPERAIATVLGAVRSGRLSESRIDQSVYRILAMKHQLGLFANQHTGPSPVDANVGTAAQLATMADIAQRAITLVRNDGHLLPLAPRPGSRVLVTGPYSDRLADDVSARGFAVRRLSTGLTPSRRGAELAAQAAAGTDLTIVTTSEAWQNSGQQGLVRALLATGRPVVVTALGSPYDLASAPNAPAVLVAYSSLPASVDALVNTLFGATPTGRLPVAVPDNNGNVIHPAGWGLGY
jgi:beta-N-acetylhexosaminidase